MGKGNSVWSNAGGESARLQKNAKHDAAVGPEVVTPEQLGGMTIVELENKGYTHAGWICAGCGMRRARGFQLMRIRRQIGSKSQLADAMRYFRCRYCRQIASPEMVKPENPSGGRE
jgi:hypothetical protein